LGILAESNQRFVVMAPVKEGDPYQERAQFEKNKSETPNFKKFILSGLI
jgi:hypothetical protein